jgi:hypothetical protein
MSKQKQKGTDGENAVVSALHRAGFTSVERRTLSGVNDKGDIAGLPKVVIEVKKHDTYAGKLAGWVEEADTERGNALATLGIVWHRRKGKAKAEEWFVTMSGEQFLLLLKRFYEAK